MEWRDIHTIYFQGLWNKVLVFLKTMWLHTHARTHTQIYFLLQKNLENGAFDYHPTEEDVDLRQLSRCFILVREFYDKIFRRS
jgi:hypothetical protein